MLVALADVKKYLRIDDDYTEEDEFITALIESAEEMLRNQTGLTSIQLESSRLSAIYVYKYVAELFESRGSTEQASLKTQNVLDNIVAQLAMCNDYRVK